MELIKKEKSWFFLDETKNYYEKLVSLKDKVVFIYSYLMQVSNKSFVENGTTFKTAILLADAISNSNLEYSSYPAIIDASKNPYVSFLINGRNYNSEKKLFAIYLSILYGLADAFDLNEWIYDFKCFKNDAYIDKLEELGRPFIHKPYQIPEPFECDEETGKIQLEIAWMFDTTR